MGILATVTASSKLQVENARSYPPTGALYLSAFLTTRHSFRIPRELGPQNTHNRCLKPIQAILGWLRKERLQGFTIYHILATLEQRISFSLSNTQEFLRLLFYLFGRSEAASATAQLGAFRDEPMYQVVCCIPGVSSSPHQLSFY